MALHAISTQFRLKYNKNEKENCLYRNLVFADLKGKSADAQIINGAYQKPICSQKKPMPLPSVREADVFWSKKSGGLLISGKK
jgi:hypothetical protein